MSIQSATGLSTALFAQAISFSETVLAGIGSLVAVECEIRSNTTVYGKVFRVPFDNRFFSDTD